MVSRSRSLRSNRELEDETGLEEYEFLYIEPPTPSKNWKASGNVFFTNVALKVLAIGAAVAGGICFGMVLRVWLKY